MKVSEMHVELFVKVPEETANGCLFMLNMYLKSSGAEAKLILEKPFDRTPYYRLEIPVLDKGDKSNNDISLNASGRTQDKEEQPADIEEWKDRRQLCGTVTELYLLPQQLYYISAKV